jgi:ATP-binding cassette subfamily C (CFTR/MRP) protein 1
LASLRAFGWVDTYTDRNDELLDESQKPVYLLAMVQQWLQTVLSWVVAVLATVLVTLATQLRSSAGFSSVALISLMTFSQYLSAIVISWTQLETSIGAVSRLKKFSEDVKSENLQGEHDEPPLHWPRHGAMEIERVSASYRYVIFS